MADMMPKKNYDLTEITRLLLNLRDNCVPKAGDAYEDPERAEKYDALNAAIDLINNPSLLQKWISVKDRLPERFVSVLVHMPGETPHPTVHEGYMGVSGWYAGGFRREDCEITHWMPLPEPPKEE